MASSIVENGGRSCVNASGVWVTAQRARDRRGAGGAARRGRRRARADDAEAQLAPFADPQVAERISAMIDRDLEAPGAEDVTARLRGSGRVARRGRLAPTCCRRSCCCDSPEHPLANREFLFPFASVVRCGRRRCPTRLGPTLVVTVHHRTTRRCSTRILASPLVDRLNLGALPT